MTGRIYHVVPGARTASLEDALRLFDAMSGVATQHGFILSVYGSVLKPHFGGGRAADVDMMAVPFAPVPAMAAGALVADLCGRFGLAQIGEQYHGLMGTLAVALKETATGVVVDLQIRELNRPAVSNFTQFSEETGNVREIRGYHQPPGFDARGSLDVRGDHQDPPPPEAAGG